jgi:hypothetical protein
MARMLKIGKEKNKFMKYLNKFFKLKVGVERLILLGLLLIIIIHITACLFYLLAKLDELNPETWVVRYGFQDESNFDVRLLFFIGFRCIWLLIIMQSPLSQLW